MAKAVGQLWVGLGVKTGDFNNGLRKAETRVETFGDKVKKVGAGLAKVAKVGAAFGVAYAAATVVGVKRAMEQIDATAKLARQIDIGTEALVAFQHAAQRTGSDSQTLDDGLKTMAANMGMAAAGTGPAIQGLELLGLKYKSLENLSTEEQFLRIADAMRRTTSASTRAAAAQQIFGGAGLKLINTLAAGRKELEEYRKEAKKLGKTYTPQQAALVEAANDAIGNMGDALNNTYLKLARDLSGIIKVIADDMTAIFSPDTSSMDNSISGLAKTVITLADAVQIVGGVVQAALGYAQKGVGGLLKYANLPSFVLSQFGSAEDVSKGLNELGQSNIDKAWKSLTGPLASEREATARVQIQADYESEERRRQQQKKAEQASATFWRKFNTQTNDWGRNVYGWMQRQVDVLATAYNAERARFQKGESPFDILNPMNAGIKNKALGIGQTPQAASALIRGTQEARSAEIAAKLGARPIEQKQLDEAQKQTNILDKQLEEQKKTAAGVNDLKNNQPQPVSIPR